MVVVVVILVVVVVVLVVVLLVLVVVGGKKVGVEINTTKEEAFFYDPLWENPVVTVQEADYLLKKEVEGDDFSTQ